MRVGGSSPSYFSPDGQYTYPDMPSIGFRDQPMTGTNGLSVAVLREKIEQAFANLFWSDPKLSPYGYIGPNPNAILSPSIQGLLGEIESRKPDWELTLSADGTNSATDFWNSRYPVGSRMDNLSFGPMPTRPSAEFRVENGGNLRRNPNTLEYTV